MWACRETYLLLEPDVSEKAYKQAMDTLNIDPRMVRWSEQAIKLQDPKRATYHLEHLLPVSEMIRRLKALGDNPSDEAILKIVKLANVVWILVEEDTALTLAKYRSKRPLNPLDAYAEVGITIRPKPEAP